jgi:uncharacterized repeat protein (TIGR01451 family)
MEEADKMKNIRRIGCIWMLVAMLCCMSFIIPMPKVEAGTYNGLDLANAILQNTSWLISSSYTDMDASGHRQAGVFSALGTRLPTDGSSFIMLSTGRAGFVPVTTDGFNPGDERGNWFSGGKYNLPRDEATLTMTLQVPPFMHYVYYDVQFFSAEYPEYIGTQYNDKLTVKVISPSYGTTTYICDVNSGDFVLNANGLPGTGYNIFATSGNPGNVDWVTTTPGPGADAGATALITREHPVSPNEQITISFDIKDSGDNLFDSAAFIDNVMFSGYAKTEMIARKTVQDLNGNEVECGDILEYDITLSNTGDAAQDNNQGNEFEDILPSNTTYVPSSATATSGSIAYNSEQKKITWNGGIPAESSIALTFKVTINSGLPNGTKISNQGTVYWDSNEDGTNDATELTDDPAINDGIDQDNDGDTNDDDPTDVYVISFEPPSTVTEDFSDDTAGGKAQQSYFGHKWFETSEGTLGSTFEVVSGYKYATVKSFKTKLRASGSPQYWNYTLSEIDCDLNAWEIWFACGSASEASTLHLDFKNTYGFTIAQIEFEYVHVGDQPPLDWMVKLKYWDPDTQWVQLQSEYAGGYLHNGWYKLRIEKQGASEITYSLYQEGSGLVDQHTADTLSAPFEDFAQIIWTNAYNPIVCPMFFWDDHTLELI